jgi:hypothetical protein
MTCPERGAFHHVKRAKRMPPGGQRRRRTQRELIDCLAAHACKGLRRITAPETMIARSLSADLDAPRLHLRAFRNAHGENAIF